MVQQLPTPSPSRASGGPPGDALEAPDKPRKPKKHHKAFENRDFPAATTQGLGQEHAGAPDRMLQPKTKSSLNEKGTVENHTPVRKTSSWH